VLSERWLPVLRLASNQFWPREWSLVLCDSYCSRRRGLWLADPPARTGFSRSSTVVRREIINTFAGQRRSAVRNTSRVTRSDTRRKALRRFKTRRFANTTERRLAARPKIWRRRWCCTATTTASALWRRPAGTRAHSSDAQSAGSFPTSATTFHRKPPRARRSGVVVDLASPSRQSETALGGENPEAVVGGARHVWSGIAGEAA